MTARVVPLRRPSPAREQHPLVRRWRRMADDPYADAAVRETFRRCARELEQHEEGEQ